MESRRFSKYVFIRSAKAEDSAGVDSNLTILRSSFASTGRSFKRPRWECTTRMMKTEAKTLTNKFQTCLPKRRPSER